MTNDLVNNKILAQFNMMVDIDIAIFKYVVDLYGSSEYVHPYASKIKNDFRIIQRLISRKYENPLKMIMPKVDTESLYHELLNTKEQELLEYAIPTDLLRLMLTYNKNVPSNMRDITILCDNEIEAKYIQDIDSSLKIIIEPDKSKIDLSNYNILYIKYYNELRQYKNVTGKYIYLPMAAYTYEKDGTTLNKLITIFYSDVNDIKLIDLYVKVKYVNGTTPEEFIDDENKQGEIK